MEELKDNKDIDVIITWVDGNDPKHIDKLNKTLGKEDRASIPGADKTRFGSINEIKYCVLSIMKFAPFVRKIFIVTDSQNPNIEADIQASFPERMDSVRVVDHKEIFEGYESFLPTFNSISIGNMVWRIKGLADKFVLFNDDVFIIRNVNPKDWFINNRPVLRGKWKSPPSLRYGFKKLYKSIKTRSNKAEYQLKPSFPINQWLAASMLGYEKKYFRSGHTPHAMSRIRIEKFFNENKELYLKNVSYQFRDFHQFNTVSLSSHIEIKDGNKNILKPNAAFMMPVNRSKRYVDRKINLCKNDESLKFICAQSLDMAIKNDVDKILDYLNNRILTE